MKRPKFYLHEKKTKYKTAGDMKYGYGEGVYRIKQLAKYARGKILDVGFAGRPNPFLKGDVTGLDLVPIEKKPKNYSETVVGDCHKMPFKDKTFDTIVSGDMLEHIENPSEFFRECYRVLKDDGVLIVSTPNASYFPLFFLNALFIKRFYFNDTHISLFHPRIMYKLLRYNKFKLVKVLSGGIYIPRTKYSLRLPATLSQHIVYVAKKVGKKG